MHFHKIIRCNATVSDVLQKVSGLPKGVLASGECMLAVNRNGLVICTAEFHVRNYF